MQARTSADLLIEARWLLSRTDLAARFEPAERIVRPHHLLMPGLVNAHTHAAMTLFRALPVRLALEVAA